MERKQPISVFGSTVEPPSRSTTVTRKALRPKMIVCRVQALPSILLRQARRFVDSVEPSERKFAGAGLALFGLQSVALAAFGLEQPGPFLSNLAQLLMGFLCARAIMQAGRNQRVATHLLQRRGQRVTIAQNGIEAVARASERQYDVILMDVQMPEMDGFEATRKLRSAEAEGGVRTPIVAMTACAMSGDRERCFEAGMDGYLDKPGDGAKMIACVENMAERSARDAAPAR